MEVTYAKTSSLLSIGTVAIFVDDTCGRKPPLQVFNIVPLVPPHFPNPGGNFLFFPPPDQ